MLSCLVYDTAAALNWLLYESLRPGQLVAPPLGTFVPSPKYGKWHPQGGYYWTLHWLVSKSIPCKATRPTWDDGYSGAQLCQSCPSCCAPSPTIISPCPGTPPTTPLPALTYLFATASNWHSLSRLTMSQL